MGGPPESRQIFVDEIQKSFEMFLNVLFWNEVLKVISELQTCAEAAPVLETLSSPIEHCPAPPRFTVREPW
jgi:hypothetical protein